MLMIWSFLFLNGNSGSLFTNSNWFAFEDDRGGNSLISPSDNSPDDAPAQIENEEQHNEDDNSDEVILDQNDKVSPLSDDMETIVFGNGPTKETNDDESMMPESAPVEPESKQVVPNGVVENETTKEDTMASSPDPVSNKKDEITDLEMEASPKMEPQVGKEVTA
jgi:serine/threonine-protein phosphatase 6 regulatory subunit 3